MFLNLPETIFITFDFSSQVEINYLFSENGLLKSQNIEKSKIEGFLINWLNMNIGKQKNGIFVPLCVLKWCLVDEENIHFPHQSL